MRRKALSIVAALSCLIFQSNSIVAQTPGITNNPQVEVEYIDPNALSGNPDFYATYVWLRVRRPLQELQQFLAPLRLPKKLKIQVDKCGADRRPYVSGGPVTICYELIDKIQKTVAANTDNDPDFRQSIVAAMFVQTTLHEVSLAIFDILEIPVWGRLEDASDRLAAFVLMQFGEKVARATILGTSTFLAFPSPKFSDVMFARTDIPAPQRYYNYLCIAIGADYADFGGLAESRNGQDPRFPTARAVQCRREYEQVRDAFYLRIMPYVDPDLLLKVKAETWFWPYELGVLGK